jgi:anti-sigma regulatory factor (Ser/Thr protein kinase)
LAGGSRGNDLLWQLSSYFGARQMAAEPGQEPLQPSYLRQAGLPVLPQVRLAARYLTAPEGVPAGGDWLDAIPLPRGDVVLAAGSIGRGPAAISVTSRLRAVLQNALLGGAAPAEALARADAFAAQLAVARGATACLGVLDPATGDLRYASAGHPMPMVCGPAGEPRFLAPAGGAPLGVGGSKAAIASAVLAPDSVLLLYSGGRFGRLPERAEHDRRLLAEAAASVLARAGPTPVPDTADRVCSAVMERVARHRHGDDAAVLTAHRLPDRVPDLFMRFPADAMALRGLRARLRDWLQALGVAPADCVDAELAAYEAAANAVVHGRPQHGPATVIVQVGLDGAGSAVIQVTDRGRWQPGESRHGGQRLGGRGLSVISQVTDELSITPGPGGTTITMRRRLNRPVPVEPVLRSDQ